MNSDSANLEQKFRKMIGISILNVPDRNFEERVMGKVLLAHSLKQQRSKSLKLSWLFLALSAVLFPGGFLIFIRQADYSFTPYIDNALKTPIQVFIPAAAIIIAIIILIQVDNLLRLTFRAKSFY
jgi:hypothetical protein